MTVIASAFRIKLVLVDDEAEDEVGPLSDERVLRIKEEASFGQIASESENLDSRTDADDEDEDVPDFDADDEDEDDPDFDADDEDEDDPDFDTDLEDEVDVPDWLLSQHVIETTVMTAVPMDLPTFVAGLKDRMPEILAQLKLSDEADSATVEYVEVLEASHYVFLP